ncbi:secretin N-terminal domain-containing protein [Vibrio ostreicida]|uniref:Secretin N-terminal domain-containing protein n=1 Tax=Vibrio ostreicida TaxID=526588 RepID=A0ABT8BY65_9VIBR|nr:secretin N-terminal domain-containing protein [Vibrio ostreicida]MDN3611634.1 secretin N-terminal domain-containing protein [Vibrio ostreicida]NPD09123.1 type II secretory pathway protein [Vibrio ostreicida]
MRNFVIGILFAFHFLCLLLLTASCFASESSTFETSNTPIAEFVSWGAREIGQPIVLGQGVTGTVSFTAPNLKPDEHASFFNNVLSAHGYWVQFEDGFYVVKPKEDQIKLIEPSLVKLYRLNHVRNSKLVDVINSTLQATRTQSVKDSPINNFTVEVLPTTNGLLVTGTKEQLSKIDILIQAIDSPQKQVFIEAIITEVTFSDAQEIGVNMQLALDKAGFVTNTTVVDVLTDSAAMFSGGNFNALVKAVMNNEDSELLSRPNILIMDRERGYITVGQNVPFLTSSEVTDGGNTVQRIERHDVGILLEVTPHVIGDEIILSIGQESSSVTNSTLASDIIINKRTLQSVVKVQNKQTIVLGGLMSKSEHMSETGIPVLMDIPLLGSLFRSEKTEKIQKELKIVMRTTIF